MKKSIHPNYYPEAKVTCVCGASFAVGSTKEVIEIEICSQCHPFYTGNEKIVDTAGRVEKFNRKRAAATPGKAKVAKTKARKEPQTLDTVTA
ncbi:MAG: 50S ribosomal protein L31 [Candidatus Vogelbacteria bacterium CG10_big_fil_rev_8_21_14_0_10_51_16]|uniref:Large ribosomal subunit protein bL31 n=1 Tax=Candidatus Vogelbacteria bacterium CG10_big_fil_rev_8_21_14_0_10_51_16 TaxID=1975045 RepID=A0A2H0RFI0_9BACT|nr:MAG: 50S ribosomal protein L31 [Candidatus Vogelbacteria bacterium CG10_big_fil_rev_8_21_14_0_10_51_16]